MDDIERDGPAARAGGARRRRGGASPGQRGEGARIGRKQNGPRASEMCQPTPLYENALRRAERLPFRCSLCVLLLGSWESPAECNTGPFPLFRHQCLGRSFMYLPSPLADFYTHAATESACSPTLEPVDLSQQLCTWAVTSEPLQNSELCTQSQPDQPILSLCLFPRVPVPHFLLASSVTPRTHLLPSCRAIAADTEINTPVAKVVALLLVVRLSPRQIDRNLSTTCCTDLCFISSSWTVFKSDHRLSMPVDSPAVLGKRSRSGCETCRARRVRFAAPPSC